MGKTLRLNVWWLCNPWDKAEFGKRGQKRSNLGWIIYASTLSKFCGLTSINAVSHLRWTVHALRSPYGKDHRAFLQKPNKENFHMISGHKTYIEALIINNMTTIDNPFCDFFPPSPLPIKFYFGQLPIAAITMERATCRTIWDFVAKEHRSLDPNLWSYGWCSSPSLPRKITPERGVILKLDQHYRLILWLAAHQLYQCNRQDDTGTLILVRGMVMII